MADQVAGGKPAAEEIPQWSLSNYNALPPTAQAPFLFTYLSSLERRLTRISSNALANGQSQLINDLWSILREAAPSRPVRAALGRCFVMIFRKCGAKGLFETFNGLVKEITGIPGSKLAGKDVKAKQAMIYVLGEITLAHGSQIFSLLPSSHQAYNRILKSSSASHVLKLAALHALSKYYAVAGRDADESSTKETLKHVKAILAEKSYAAQVAALNVLNVVAREQPPASAADFDTIKSLSLKGMESRIKAVREAGSLCFASLLKGIWDGGDSEMGSEGRESTSTKAPGSKRTGSMPVDGEDVAPPTTSKKSRAASGPQKYALPLQTMLLQISMLYGKLSSSPALRTGLIRAYAALLQDLGNDVVQESYANIAHNLLVEIAPVANGNPLWARKHVRLLLSGVIAKRMLGETSQINAIKFLLEQYIAKEELKTDAALCSALEALQVLITALGSAITAQADILRTTLLNVVTRSKSREVQISAAWSIRCLVNETPVQISPVMTFCINNTSRDLSALNTPAQADPKRRAIACAEVLAGVCLIAKAKPLYVNLDVMSRVLNLATTVLKKAGDYVLGVSCAQQRIAWVLIGGLMSLGHGFAKTHLSQLLLLWKNSLPKPLIKDFWRTQSNNEVMLQLEAREATLSSLLCFLKYNKKLLTLDVSRRIIAMLGNALVFVNGVPSAKKDKDDLAWEERVKRAQMTRRRILQCHLQMSESNHMEAVQSELLTLSLSLFADLEAGPRTVSSALGVSGESLWGLTDNYACGVTSLIKGMSIVDFPFEGESDGEMMHFTKRISVEDTIEQMLDEPIVGAVEHDPTVLYTLERLRDGIAPQPISAATAVVDSAIELFAVTFPSQPAKVQESILEQLATVMTSPRLQKDPQMKLAVQCNAVMALLGVFKVFMTNTQTKTGLNAERVVKIAQEIIQAGVTSTDDYLRNAATQALGRLINVCGNQYMAPILNSLIGQIVSNQNPHARAGSAVALSSVYKYVGGMAASLYLKTIAGILTSLSNDPHPTVHFWALDALTVLIESAGLSYSGQIPSALEQVTKLYTADSHDSESASVATANIAINLPTTQTLVRCTDAIINVIGPDMAMPSKNRELIMDLIASFSAEGDEGVATEAVYCTQNLSLFIPQILYARPFINRLRRNMLSPDKATRSAAVSGVHHLVRRDAATAFHYAGDGFELYLWHVLDASVGSEGVKNIIRSWLQQTAAANPVYWSNLCQRILTMPLAKANVHATPTASQGPDLGDEEVASMAQASDRPGDNGVDHGSGELMRWQTRCFALECLLDVINVSAKEASIVREGAEASPLKLVGKVAELIRMAFTASTAAVFELRLTGLHILRAVVKVFSRVPDPDFPEYLLLEQYQAQIASALTPAFAADSYPELAASAFNICAEFVASGIAKDAERMSRILKLLGSGLEGCSHKANANVMGELKNLSGNAMLMLKLSILTAWAELQIASQEQEFLLDVVKPHVPELVGLWLETLKDYARLRFEPEGSGSMASPSSTNRDVLLSFYQEAWLRLVDAIASLIDQDSEFVFAALDNRRSSVHGHERMKSTGDINYRAEPAAFFFVLFGICFEALATGANGESSTRTLDILLALQKILRPSVCGQAIYKDVIFAETTDLFDRLVLLEGGNVQSAIVHIACNLAKNHPFTRLLENNEGRAHSEGLSDEVDQLFELERIVTLALVQQIPSLHDKNDVSLRRGAYTADAVQRATATLAAFVDMAETFPSIIKGDLYDTIFHIFGQIMMDQDAQATLAPQSLAILKIFCRNVAVAVDRGLNGEGLLSTIVRGALTHMVDLMNKASAQEGYLATPSAKNMFLATTLISSALGHLVPSNDGFIAKFSYTLETSLSSQSDEVAAIALQCIRSLILSSKRSIVGQQATLRLLPHLITFISSPSPKVVDEVSLAEDACDVLVEFVKVIPPEKAIPAMTIVIATFTTYATNPAINNVEDTAERLLTLARLNADAFKTVVANLPAAQKTALERILKGGREEGTSMKSEATQPTISLKMDFGGFSG
ncbi:hypothetical protein YB2330_003497 [Saitoella coloradoensis]